jgi:ankyrin repeat protein
LTREEASGRVFRRSGFRAFLVWLGRLVPGLYEVIQYTLSLRKENARVLLAAGARLNAVDNDGETAPHKDASRGSTEVVRALLAAVASVRAVDNEGETPLQYAAHHGHNAEARALRGAARSQQGTASAGSAGSHASSAGARTRSAETETPAPAAASGDLKDSGVKSAQRGQFEKRFSLRKNVVFIEPVPCLEP